MIKIVPVLVALSASSINIQTEKPGIPGKSSFVPPDPNSKSLHVSLYKSHSVPLVVSTLYGISSRSFRTSNSKESSTSILSSSSSSSSSIFSSFSSSSSLSHSSSSMKPSSSAGQSSVPQSTSISSTSFAPVPDSMGDYLFCDECGPFPLENPTDINVTFTYELHSISSQRIIERMRFFLNGSVVAGTTQPSFEYTNGQRKTVSFEIPLHDYWTFNGLEIRFEILNSSRTIIKAYAASFYPPEEQTISGYSLKQNIYTSKSVGFYGDGSGLRELKDTFNFTTLGDYIDNDYYYRLDISKNTFEYWGSNTVPYRNVNLRFNDDEYLFPNIRHEDNDDIVIPLKLDKEGSKISFRYKNQFYVNGKTLDISDTYRNGYILTSHFYLPVNGLAKFNDKTIYLDFDAVGVSGLTTSIPLKYDMNRSIVGVCADGDYCVVGGNH